MANLPRRNFLKTIGSAAVVSAFPNVLLAAPQRSLPVAVFWEEGFPIVLGCGMTKVILQQALDGFAVSFLTERELIAQLNVERFDLLITPHGSAFPKRAWNVLLKYLRAGGNWLNLGGVPFSRPVVRRGNEWSIETPQATYHKLLGITHSFPVLASTVTSYHVEDVFRSAFEAREIFELYVRLSSTNSEPNEAGSDGPHEGVVAPFVLGLSRELRPIAAPVIQIDRLEADFAGGRWMLANFSGTLNAKGVRRLAQITAQGASRLEVISEFACYRPQETPSFTVRLSRPKGDLDKLAGSECRVLVVDQNGASVSNVTSRFDIQNKLAVASVKLPPDTKLASGFYRVNAIASLNSTNVSTEGFEPSHANGFWIDDAAKRGKPLTVDKHFFYREGKVFPVTGATYMASDKHRRFLFEPNPAVWDDDFRQMKEAGVNMVRTGIWTGWKKYMPEPGKVSEATLRAFDAFLLTANKYDIPVIFTFFAFLPETWGGENAYLDPRSIKAQQQFISAFTLRSAHIDDVIWDFINEPSFGSYKYIWSCRPNYDVHENAAWKQWLRERYPAATDEEHQSKLQELWRTTSDDVLELPKVQDFESVNLIDERLPLKTLDYRLFAQDMFIRWVRQMTPAIKSNGNPKQLITVGQDENGLGDSPNPQFFSREIDFGSLHNWWNNDDLVWDSVLAKVPAKLNLMEETGVMFYEKSDGGAPWRSEAEASRLLERKLALSFAADGAGFIEWVWNTNPYMNSTNEVGIGFYRVDRTAKPELEPFLRIAKFMGQHGERLQERASEPVAMVIPHSQMFSPRSFAHEATRKCVRAMYYHCGVPMQAVSEYTIHEYAGKAKLFIVPSPRVLTQKCWDALLAEARRGATVAISGPFFSDEHWRSAVRNPVTTRPTIPVSETERITIGQREYLVRFDGEKMQRIEKALVERTSPVQPITVVAGSGKIIWSPLPLELSDSMSAIAAFYKFALAQAQIKPVFTALPRTPAVLILPSVFRDVVLYTFVSEINRETRMQVTHLESGTRFSVSVPTERTAMVLLERKTGKLIGKLSA